MRFVFAWSIKNTFDVIIEIVNMNIFDGGGLRKYNFKHNLLETIY